MDQIKIGNYLRYLRTEKELTQAQLAEEIGVSNRSVSRWENGSSLPDLSILVWLAEFYDVEISELIKGQNKEEMDMKDISKKTLQDIVEYTDHAKKDLMRFYFYLFIIGIILSVTGYFLQKNYFGTNDTIDFIIGVCHGVGFGLLVIGALITSGIMDRWVTKISKKEYEKMNK